MDRRNAAIGNAVDDDGGDRERDIEDRAAAGDYPFDCAPSAASAYRRNTAGRDFR